MRKEARPLACGADTRDLNLLHAQFLQLEAIGKPQIQMRTAVVPSDRSSPASLPKVARVASATSGPTS